MITRIYIHGLISTAIVALALPYCIGSVLLMIVWLLGFACYLGLVLAHLIDLEHIEASQLSVRDEPSSPLPAHYTDRTNVAGAPPFRFVGLTEQREALRKYRSNNRTDDLQ